VSVSAREVWVEVGADGKVRVLYRGFAGDECFREAQRIYELLKAQGVEVTVEQVVPTQEYYQEQRQRVKADVLR
jgi:type 1 glutamine amidotransferase